ncbi:MAG: TetR/AcrR family transcriptional regulator [Lachnospiraceae bacterium]
MAEQNKSDLILDALQQLMNEKDIRHISVSEIAEKAGIGKGSIYYYYPSKDAIFDALIHRGYEQPLKTAKNLVARSNISSYTRMAMIFQACRSSTTVFLNNYHLSRESVQSLALLHQKHLNFLISELKPALADIISQGIACGEIQFEYPEELAEIALIVIGVKLDNYIIPATTDEIDKTLRGLIALLEKGTSLPKGTLEYLSIKND